MKNEVNRAFIAKKKLSYICILATVALFSACSLDRDPISDQSELNIGSSEAGDSVRIKFKDRAAIYAVYNDLYNVMRDRQEHWYLDYLLFGESRTDNAYAGTTGAEVVPVETNALDASNPDIARDWDRYLEDIAKANVVISNIDLVPDPAFAESERKQWKAEALIFRSMMIFDLAHWFGNIPLNLTEAPDITAANIEEVYPIYFPMPVSQDSAYKRVQEDLLAAIPNAPAINAGDKTRLSKTVAYALLAKLYAELGEWDKVVEYCDLVFGDGIRLEPNFADLWGYDKETGDAVLRNSVESILEMQYYAGSGSWVTWMFGRDAADPESNFTWAKWITPSRDLINAFDKEGDVIRKNQTIVWDQCAWSNYYPASNYPFMYKCRSAYNSIIKLRGADIQLLKAEALAHKGDLAGAAILVNEIRARVGLAELPASKTSSESAMLESILNERRLELALEGQRLFDLIRFGKLMEIMNDINSRDEGRLPQARPFVEEHRLMPIPQTALDKNANLQQNAGY
ncbi:MAG: RagB/SusD family nutrient uptake outer membrane protein [Paludibacteraceae bacterium]|nr:RagB/SusD family nutrient uptake outer membrane protein [Paludibacteraceae bacterium]